MLIPQTLKLVRIPFLTHQISNSTPSSVLCQEFFLDLFTYYRKYFARYVEVKSVLSMSKTNSVVSNHSYSKHRLIHKAFTLGFC